MSLHARERPQTLSFVKHDAATQTLHRGAFVPEPLPVVLRPIGQASPRELHLRAGTCTLGSGSRCDLVLDDPTVSRTHAELTLVAEGVLVRDLESRNGTFYLGQRITNAVLSPGTRITLGGATVAIDLDEAHLAQSAAAVAAPTSFRGMIGTTPAMMRLFTTLARLDGSLVPVLVQGESGVGKELVARAIHEGSRAARGPFVAVNCGAVSRELVGSALFGHARGAFTGAVSARKGAFAAADGGTLLLDEIGELPLDVQPALLRALETGEVQALGDDATRRVSVRVIAATHRDLPQLVRSGAFREDLFFRLAVVQLSVPPLRERREDVPVLARFFARQEGAADLDDDIVEELAARPLQGNVRELRNAVLAYLALGSLAPSSVAPPNPTVDPSAPVRFDVPYLAQRDALVDAFTTRYLSELLAHTNGNQSEAARIAGLDRTYLGRMIGRFGVARRK